MIIKGAFSLHLSRPFLTVVFLALVLGILSCWLRWQALSQTEYGNGWDSYFYLVQLKALDEEGAMHSRDASLIYPWLHTFTNLSGDYLKGFKAGLATLAGLITMLMTMLGFRFSRKLSAAFLLGTFSLFSPSLTFFTAQFPKNLLGMTLLLLFLLLWLGRNRIAQLIGFLLTFLSHRLTAGLALLLVLLSGIRNKKLLLLGLGGGASLLLTALLLPGLLHWSDFQRFEGEFQALPQAAPFSFLSLMGAENVTLFWKLELFLLWGLWLFALVQAIRGLWRFQEGYHVWQALLVLCCLLLFPFFSMEVGGMGYRFFLAFLLVAPLLIGMRLWAIPPLFAYLIGLVFLIAAPFSYQAYQPDRQDPGYAKYEEIARRATALFKQDTGVPELLIAHKGMAELFTFQTGIDALPWQPEYEIDSSRLWRLATDVDPMELQFFLPVEDRENWKQLALTWHLIREDAWQRVLLRAEADGDTDFLSRARSWRNPFEQRPAYLLRNKE